MYSPRKLMIVGVVLIAIALGASGHGFWWLFGLFWMLPHAGRHAQVCGGAARRRDHGVAELPQDEPAPPPAQPDPNRDRHEAFPGR